MYHDQPFWFKVPISPPFWSISMPCTLTNSSYRLNITTLQFTQYHPQTLNMKSYQKLSPTWNMGGHGAVHNFNIQFHMYSKFITHVYLHTLILCHIHNTTYWTQEFRQTYLHDIYGFFPPYHTLQDDMQLKGEHTLQQHRHKSIIKTQLTTNSFEGFFTCGPFCFYVDCR